MRIVGMFRAATFGEVARTHPEEVRHKCDSCKWVNIFHPIAASWRTLTLK
jgi:hypothetical protein